LNTPAQGAIFRQSCCDRRVYAGLFHHSAQMFLDWHGF
jgi:hypothetical protein